MVLEVRDLQVKFAGAPEPAVRDVGFSARRGEVLGITGESGSGKTLTALAVLGLLPPGARAAGSVRLRGQELLGASDARLARVRGKDITMIFQDPLAALTPVYPVGKQIAETIRAHARIGRRAARARAAELLDLVGIPDPARRAGAYPHELSGGMRQRAMIAMAVANKPQVILADEPTTALDMTVQEQVLDVLRAATAATGAALILVTHDLGVIARLADRVLEMRAGRIVREGAAADMLGSADPLATPRRPPDAPDAPDAPIAPVAPVAPVAPGPPAAGRAAVLEVSGLVRCFSGRGGAVRAVDGVSFEVREGETLGLVGESGSGKTTTLMEILRLAAPQRGRVKVLGRDAAALSAAGRRALRRDVQVVFQDPLASLDPRMTVAAALAEPLITHGHARAAAAARAGWLLELVGLDPPLAARYPGGLSGGQQQRVCIARALALEPKLLLLDEPVSALDIPVRAGIIALLAELKERLGLSYLLVSHDLAVVRRLADRVAVLHGGKIVETGSVERIYRAPAHPSTRALLAALNGGNR